MIYDIANVFWLSSAKPQKIPSVKSSGFSKNKIGTHNQKTMTTWLQISVLESLQHLLHTIFFFFSFLVSSATLLVTQPNSSTVCSCTSSLSAWPRMSLKTCSKLNGKQKCLTLCSYTCTEYLLDSQIYTHSP